MPSVLIPPHPIIWLSLYIKFQEQSQQKNRNQPQYIIQNAIKKIDEINEQNKNPAFLPPHTWNGTFLCTECRRNNDRIKKYKTELSGLDKMGLFLSNIVLSCSPLLVLAVSCMALTSPFNLTGRLIGDSNIILNKWMERGSKTVLDIKTTYSSEFGLPKEAGACRYQNGKT